MSVCGFGICRITMITIANQSSSVWGFESMRDYDEETNLYSNSNYHMLCNNHYL